MAMIAPAPTAHIGFAKEYTWDSSRFQSYPQHNSSSNAVSLPSIRHHFGDLLSPCTSPVHSVQISPHTPATGYSTSQAYVYSPPSTKRRRTPVDDEFERSRARQTPRLLRHGEQQSHEARSPHATLPVAPPAPVEMSERSLHVENGPAAPNFPPTLSTERPVGVRPVARDSPLDDYRDTKTHHASRQAHQVPPLAAAENTHRHAGPAYEYAYRHPSQTHTASSSHHTYERSPFSAGTYTRHSYPEYPRYSEMGHAGAPHDQKQRKRRGNLPKETTDKLRSWFHAHVSHPYPTEDEKQELMRQTGLQMNQISNWFINARRRQLPAMITNARVTSDAMSGRSAEGKALSSTEGSEPHIQQDGLTLSDGEGVPYEEELESFQRYRESASKRTSV